MDIHILFIYIYISPWIGFCALNTRLPMLSTGAGAVLYTIHSKILGCPRQRGIDRSWKHWSWNIRVTRISTVVSWWSRTSFFFFCCYMKSTRIAWSFVCFQGTGSWLRWFHIFSVSTATARIHRLKVTMKNTEKLVRPNFTLRLLRGTVFTDVSCACRQEIWRSVWSIASIQAKPLDIGVAYLSD